MKFIKTQVELLDNKPYFEVLDKIETAGRTCYASPKKDSLEDKEKFVRGIIKRGHESVIEHECLTFKVVTDRAIANEMVRHRIASYSQASSRYIDLSNIPVVFEEDDEALRSEIKKLVENAEESYKKLIELGAGKDVARSVLPLTTATEIVVTMNFRSLRHFLKLRSAKAAHKGIRIVAQQMLHIMKEKYPVFVEDF